MPELLGLDHCCVTISMEVGKYESCHFVQDCIDFLGSLEFCVNFKNSLSGSIRRLAGIVRGMDGLEPVGHVDFNNSSSPDP